MTKHNRLLRPIVAVITAIILIAAVVFFFRYRILQYTADSFIRRALPGYVKIGRISFNVIDNRISVRDFRIDNPQGFNSKHLLKIDEITVRYSLKGKSVFDGIELSEPVFIRPVFYIERLSDSRTNIGSMQYIQEGSQGPDRTPARSGKAGNVNKPSGGAASALIKLPEYFTVKSGRIIFIDDMVRPVPFSVAIDKIEADLRVVMDERYSAVLSVSTTGQGRIDDISGGTIKWITSFDPTAPALTMSNRFDVSGVDILTFKPYYDKYSPLDLKSGHFAGELIFDFDRGNIGSTNRIALSGLEFSVKPGQESARVIETSVPELVKYFRSASGDIIFDFKIKGPVSEPQFFLGPISKQALASMAIDKITEAIAQASQESGRTQTATSGTKATDLEKAAQYIDMFKGFLKDDK